MFESYYENKSNCEDNDKDVYEERQFQNEVQQQIFSGEEDVDDLTCNILTWKEEVILRKPLK